MRTAGRRSQLVSTARRLSQAGLESVQFPGKDSDNFKAQRLRGGEGVVYSLRTGREISVSLTSQ